MITVVELPEFISRAKKLLSETERDALISYLSAHPVSGVILTGTGGIRKLRWKREGAGKSGGNRVIYYYHSERYPLFLLNFSWTISFSCIIRKRNYLRFVHRKII